MIFEMIVLFYFIKFKPIEPLKPVEFNIAQSVNIPQEKVVVTSQESEVVNLINQTRASAGLRKLSIDYNLNASACNKANDMVKYDYWAHNNPNGTSWSSFITTPYRTLGENLARGFTSMSSQHQAWLASPTHYQNIVGNYSNVGVCFNHYSSGLLLTVTHFGGY